MAQSFLIFDFGEDEAAAQHARHRIDGWKQAFRLDKKMQLKFDRKEAEAAGASAENSQKAAGSGSKAKGGSKKATNVTETSEDKAAPNTDINLIIRLDFSDHEKLSHHSWLNRIPSEEPFKTAKSRIVRSGDPEFAATADRFDSLD